MLAVARVRGRSPRAVPFGTWYPGKDNPTAVRALGWPFLTRARCDRRADPGRTGNRAIEACDIAASGAVVHLEGLGPVKAFRIAAGDGGTEHWTTNDLAMGPPDRGVPAGHAWGTEEYHRGLERHGDVDRCQARVGPAPAAHARLAIRAFLRLERHRRKSGVSWFAAKTAMVRDAVRNYLAAPRYRLPEKSTA